MQGLSRAHWVNIGLAFLVGVLLSALVAILLVQATAREAAASYAAVVANPSNMASTDDMDALAARFAVTIVWTDDDRNCGAGCYDPRDPNVIYVAPGMDAETTRYVVLHELGHVLQFRVGMAADECAADRFAQSMGSTMGGYCPV